MFLHNVTCLPIKDNNKHFISNLGDTNDVMFSLNDFLDFNPINNYFKSCVSLCVNRTISNITSYAPICGIMCYVHKIDLPNECNVKSHVTMMDLHHLMRKIN
jgi:hypothetical protein